LEVVAKAIYLLNFYSGSPVCPATLWIISGLRSCHKSVTAPAPQFFSWTWLRSGAIFFHGSGSSSGFCSFSRINIFIVLVCL